MSDGITQLGAQPIEIELEPGEVVLILPADVKWDRHLVSRIRYASCVIAKNQLGAWVVVKLRWEQSNLSSILERCEIVPEIGGTL